MKALLLNIKQVQASLDISRSGVYRLIRDGDLAALKVRGSLKITASSMAKFIEDRTKEYKLDNGFLEYPE